MAVYNEQQYLNPWIRWSGICLISALVITGILSWTIWMGDGKGELISMFVGILGGIIAVVVMIIIRLDIRMNREVIEYKMFPLEWKKKTIKIKEVESIDVRKFRKFPGYGGFGKRRKPWRKEIAYVLSWKAGLFVKLKDGKMRVFSTTKPAKLEQFIKQMYSEKLNQKIDEKV